MNRNVILTSISYAFVLTTVTEGQPIVTVTSDVGDQVLQAEYAEGEVIAVVFQVRSDDDAGVFGAEINMDVATDDIAIRSVIVAPAFSTRSEVAAPDLPVARYGFVCTQPADRLERSLGAAGRDVELMTVELEVRNSAPFETTLEIGARVALIGKASTRTVIFDDETTEYVGDMARNCLTIINTGQPEQDVPWLRETADLSLTVYEPGGRERVESLIAGRPYELHYASTAPGVCSYVVTTVAEDPGHGIRAATAPAMGGWRDGVGFTFTSSARAAEYGLPAAAPWKAETRDWSWGAWRLLSICRLLVAIGPGQELIPRCGLPPGRMRNA